MNQADYRIFGFTLAGAIRANLYDGLAFPKPGNRYSWTTAATVQALADKLERRFEQPLSDEELDAIEQLGAASADAVCDTCGGTGADPGAIDPAGEPCPDCSGRREPRQPALAEAFDVLRKSLTAPRKGPETVLAPTRRKKA